jgi:predicted phosphate transport protein (TIGR00153 family)
VGAASERVIVLLGGAPRYGELYELFARAGQNAERASGLLVQLMAEWPDDGNRLRIEIKELEELGDRITHDVIHHLHTKAATPFPVSDAHELISELDDVVDFAEEVADFMGLYRVEAPTDQAIELARILHEACAQLAAALGSLSDLPRVRPHVREIDRLEHEGDRVEREALTSLFEGGIDPMVVIRWKDIYERLEAAIDACRHVGNTLQGLIVKRA